MGANSSLKKNDVIHSWSGPSAQNAANSYTQHVQNFWTDERLAAAAPISMPTDASNDSNIKPVGPDGEIKK